MQNSDFDGRMSLQFKCAVLFSLLAFSSLCITAAYLFKKAATHQNTPGITVLERNDTPIEGLYLYRTLDGDFFGNIEEGVIVNGVLEDMHTGESLYRPTRARKNLPYINQETVAGATWPNPLEQAPAATPPDASAMETALQLQLSQIQENDHRARSMRVAQEPAPSQSSPSNQAPAFTTAPPGAIPRVGFDNNGRPLTPAQKQSQTAQLMESLPEQWMMVYPASEERHVVTVMTDPTCPYCRALHESVGELNANGVTVRYLFYPRALNAGPTDLRAVALVNRINAAWCSSNQEMALNALFAGESPGRPCSDLDESDTRPRDPTADHFVIGQILDVTGTPHIVHHTGKMWQGFSGVEAFMNQLDGLGEV